MVKEPRLEMHQITKEFPGVKALSNVNVRLYPGEVHALMGENGAGKSTLIKVLTGVYTIDSGTVLYEGKEVQIRNPLEAQQLGISTVYQEVNLCTNLSVTENIFIGRELKKRGKLDWKEMHKQTDAILKERMQLSIDVKKQLSYYSVAIQQMIAIARALVVEAKVLILDEPTSSLDKEEVNQLFRVMRRLKNDGIAIVFVSHFLDQIYEITDRLTVLRNGQFIGEYLTKDISRMELVSKMIGKELEQMEKVGTEAHVKQVDKEIFMEAKSVGAQGKIAPFDLQLRKKEVLGLAGLLGSGRTELARLLYGADHQEKGEIFIHGKKVKLQSPRHAILEKIAFCSEDRKAEGIIPDLTVRENMILAIQGVYGWFKHISKQKQTEIADEYIKLLNINPANPEHLIKNLSGGNQQKVMLARWLITDPELLILDEPTRGIDIGAKTEIMKLMVKLSKEGKSVLFISSEIEEILRSCDRIAVLSERKKVKEMDNNELVTQQTLMKEMAGGI
ncbi:sugar ABC transporter ATP-binding protein [Gracilibacillus marinus]|uniref:Sugar ABC transporter ATP-binding protein n=1 Tax=Gracilibacillus marinus TaxID=630535 RepID=A0ABV8VSP1_9BACI